MLVAAVLIPNFAFHAERSRSLNNLTCPFLIVERKPEHITVMDFTPGLPVQVGMKLEKALAKIPKVRLVDADILYYEKTWNEFLDIFHLYSSSIESERVGLAYVDLFDQNQLSAEDFSSLISKQQRLSHSLPIQIGIGKNKYLAYIAARQAKPGHSVIAPHNVKDFLAHISIDYLPISPKSHSALKEFGLLTLGDITRHPLGPMQAQFGNEGHLIWNLAHGNDNRPITNRIQRETIAEKMSFVSPLDIFSAILIAVEALLKRIFTHPQRRGRAVLQMDLQANTEKERWAKNIVFRPAQETWTTCLRIIERKLERESFPGALEDLQIIASGWTKDLGHQKSLFSNYRKKEQLGELIKTLEVQLGPKPHLWQVREIEPWSRIPERRMVLIPFVP